MNYSREELQKLYSDLGTYKMAKLLNKSAGSISYLLRKFSIPQNRGHKGAVAWNKNYEYKEEEKGWKWPNKSKEKFSKSKKELFASTSAPRMDFNKGKSWDEIFGKEKAEVMRKNLYERNSHGIKTANTSIEIALQKALSDLAISFQTQKPIFINGKRLTTPDIFIEPLVCIYADGDYWHNLPENKIKDLLITSTLKENGYVVLRFWERDIKKNLKSCVSKILEVIS